MNKLQKLLIAGLVAGSFGSIAAPAMADTVIIRQAPPPPRAERTPPPRRGHVWAPGHWEYRHGRYVWNRGTWLRERHGYAYNAPNWVERDGRWMMERGGWLIIRVLAFFRLLTINRVETGVFETRDHSALSESGANA